MRSSTIGDDLAFLDAVFPRLHLIEAQRYQHAPWLASDFHAEVWECTFERSSATRIDWRVQIGANGDLLTSPRHCRLWETFRSWLVLSTHPDTQAGALWSPATMYFRFSVVVDWIDYFLLRADELGLPEHGLECLTQDELLAAVHAIGAYRDKKSGIYQWSERVAGYLRYVTQRHDQCVAAEAVSEFPFLGTDLPESDERLTALSDDEVVAARVYMWRNGFYSPGGGSSSYAWRLKPSRLVPLVYPNCLRRGRGKGWIPELDLIPVEPRVREYPPAPISTTHERMSRPRLAEYVRAMSRLGLLSNVGLPIPLEALRSLDESSVLDSMDLKGTGRYKTLPSPVVFCGLRKAIEFILQYGDDLVKAYLALAEDAHDEKVLLGAVLSSRKGHAALTPNLKALGIERWSVNYLEIPPIWRQRTPAKQEYFNEFRAGAGLWNLLRVLYGAVQMVVGTLMARRVGELVELQVGRCVDESGRYLIFENRKSGVVGLRDSLARPIPPIATTAIRLLEGLQDGLIELGILEERTNLFAFPKGRQRGLVSLNQYHYNQTLDYFCDYVETAQDAEGRRYYIRQHQLRRFFAMVFFWSNSFGGMDTLREFLGHTDAEHLYRYITESTPGGVLSSVKAEWASEAVKVQWREAEALADMVAERFGTRNFRLLGDDELTDYIECLMGEGRVEIEPEFLDTKGQYRILIKVIRR